MSECVCMCVCIHACMCVDVSVCVCVCVHVYSHNIHLFMFTLNVMCVIMPSILFAFLTVSLIYKLFKDLVFINKNSQIFFYLYTLKLPAINKIIELWIIFANM